MYRLATAKRAGEIGQRVDAPEAGDCRFHRGLHLRWLEQVDRRKRPPIVLRAECLFEVLAADVEKDDARAGIGKPLRDRTPEIAGCSGDDHNVVLEVHACSYPAARLAA